MDAFDYACGMVLLFEGGYVNDPRDAGGETKYGISRRAYPDVDIAGLTVAEARRIYRRDYWDLRGLGVLPGGIAIALMDAFVTGGHPVRWMQAAVGVKQDGLIGPVTLKAVMGAGVGRVVSDVQEARLRYFQSLPGWSWAGVGWARRVHSVSYMVGAWVAGARDPAEVFHGGGGG